MDMLLMGAAISFFGIVVSSLAFGAAARTEQPETQAFPEVEPATVRKSSNFFIAGPPEPAHPFAQVPIEALLLQIEHHVRMEQAAAESYVQLPSAALLHAPSITHVVQ